MSSVKMTAGRGELKEGYFLLLNPCSPRALQT